MLFGDALIVDELSFFSLCDYWRKYVDFGLLLLLLVKKTDMNFIRVFSLLLYGLTLEVNLPGEALTASFINLSLD